VQTVEALFSDLGKILTILRRFYDGTVICQAPYVLERFIDRTDMAGTKGLMLSFGPGFSAQRVLLQF
jgi:predicted naringenin-chalcone synthase